MRAVFFGLLFILGLAPTAIFLALSHPEVAKPTPPDPQPQALEQRVAVLEQRLRPLHVTVTHYTASADETDSDPDITAILERPRVGRTVAVSRDLKHLLGKKIYLEGYGIRWVNDLMAKGAKMRVDVLVGTKKGARLSGVVAGAELVRLD